MACFGVVIETRQSIPNFKNYCADIIQTHQQILEKFMSNKVSL
jgi:hypothetical protein